MLYFNIRHFSTFVCCWQQIDDVSPTGRYTTAVPLLLVLSCSAIKEIIEDYVSLIWKKVSIRVALILAINVPQFLEKILRWMNYLLWFQEWMGEEPCILIYIIIELLKRNNWNWLKDWSSKYFFFFFFLQKRHQADDLVNNRRVKGKIKISCNNSYYSYNPYIFFLLVILYKNDFPSIY